MIIFLISLFGIGFSYITLPLKTIKVYGNYDLHYFNKHIKSRIPQQIYDDDLNKQQIQEEVHQELQQEPIQDILQLMKKNDVSPINPYYDTTPVTYKEFERPIYEYEQNQIFYDENYKELTITIDSSQNITNVNETNYELDIIPLDNYYNYQYVGFINVIDSNYQQRQFNVIFDSGSSWLWLPGENCKGCQRNKVGLNCTGDPCIITKEEHSIMYSIGEINGKVAEAQFSLNNNEFHKKKFLYVNEAKGMEGALFDGIVGLELNQEQEELLNWPVGFYLNQNENSPYQSELNFGGPNLDLLNKQSQFIYLPVHDNWVINLESISAQRLLAKDLQVVIDSGSSLIMFPQRVLNEFYELFQQSDLACKSPENSYTSLKCSCPTQDLTVFPTLQFEFSPSIFITLEPQYYIHNNADSHLCHLLISPVATHDQNLVIIGNPFMRKYYTLFDKSNRRVGLHESINTLPYEQKFNYQKIFNFILLTVTVILASSIIIILVNCHIKKQLKPSNQNSFRLV